MKGTLRTKKTITLILIIAVLLVGAVAGVTLYLKDEGETSATDIQNQDSQTASENLNQQKTDANQIIKDEVAENQSTENEEAIQNSEQQLTEREDIVQNGEEQTVENDGNVQVLEEINQEEDSDEEDNDVQENETDLPQQEFVQYRDKLVAEDYLVGWTPISVSALVANTNRAINAPILEISKASYTEADLMETGELVIPEEIKYNALRQRERIIYEIKVLNKSNIDAKSIRVIDNVPEKTTLQDIEGNGTEKNGTITWIIDIPALSEVKLRFAVTVNEDAEGNAENIALVNGDETNKVKNPIIITEKSSKVYRAGNFVEKAKVGDTIKYTIKIKNTGDIDGTTKVTDKVPVGSKLVESSLTGATVSQDGTILWDNVLIPAGQEKILEFEVTINLDVTTSVKNQAIVSETETNETEDKVANIEGHKVVDKSVAWVGEELTYKITLVNNGSISGAVVVTDVIPDGTTYVENSVTANGEYDASTNKITWTNVEVIPETPVELTFKVKINLDRTTSIFNTAILDGKEIQEKPETKVINIIGEKTSTHDDNLTEEGRINYTIKLTNIGNATGKITVTDQIPQGTTYVVGTVDSKGSYDSSTNKITWTNVEVTPEQPVQLTFSVTVNPFKGETKKIENQASIGNKVEDEATKKLIDIPVTKTWINDAEAKTLRTDIRVELLRGTEPTGNIITIQKTEQDTWTATFKNLPKYDLNGNIITYSVRELTKIDGYTSSVNGMTITNSFTNPTKNIKVTKVWVDNNISGERPESIKLQVKGNGKTYEQTVSAANKTANAANVWEYTFTVPKYNSTTSSRSEIQYIVDETEVNSGDLQYYKKSINGTTITNTLNFTRYTANVEEYSTTTKNKNVYIVLDASSSMNHKLNGQNKMEVACNNVAALIRNVFTLSSNSTVEVITFNTTKNDNRFLVGTEVFGSRATNAISGNSLADSIDAITEAPWSYSSSYDGYTRTWGTNMHAALSLVNSEIDGYNNGNENIVIFVGDGAPTNNDRYPNGYISDPYNKNCNCPVYNMARTIRGKVSEFFVLGVDLATTSEDYTAAEARAILENLATENDYYNVANTSGFTTAFDSLFTKMNTFKFDAKNEEYNPYITIQANGTVLLGRGVILTSAQGTETFTTQDEIDATLGISYNSSTKTFTIDTRIINGNISLKYTIQ